jgi:PAS domain-containing protein
MTLPTPESPTHAAPRINLARFDELLRSKNSPVGSEAAAVWQVLVSEGVDPSFALAQFRVESQYGTAGWAKETGSWGNMHYDENLTVRSGPPMTFYTSTGNKHVFATYDNYVDAIHDYINYIHWYRDRHGLETIYEATGRWLGLTRTGDSGHIAYVNTIVADMVAYEHEEGEFYEVGDAMIYTDDYVDRATGKITKRMRVKAGTTLYRGTNGDVLKTLQPAGSSYLDLLCTGPVQGSTTWAGVLVGTTQGGRLVYIKNPDWTAVRPA